MAAVQAASGWAQATQTIFQAAPRVVQVVRRAVAPNGASQPQTNGSSAQGPAAVSVVANGAAPGGGANGSRHGLERLSDQLEGCEEAESLKTSELVERMGIPLDSEGEAAAPVTSMPDALPWPGEEMIFEEGFTPRAMVALTNHIRSSCAGHCETEGGPAVISPGLLLKMLSKAEDQLLKRGGKALVEFHPPPGERVIIVGDLHGQLPDCLWIFYRYGLPSESAGNCFLFNGDIADRGRFAVEIFVLLIGWMLVFPGAVFINRGNHEDVLVNTSRCGGFYDEVISKYPDFGRQVFEAFGRFFAALPLAHILGPNRAKILVVHGGLPRVPSQFISGLRHMDARGPTVPMRTTSLSEVIVKDVLWSDPKETRGHEVSTRGASLMQFGPDVTLNFCHQELVGLVVRSHEVPLSGEGFAFTHENRLCTVFSASNYKGIEHNSGAVLLVTSADLAVGNLAKSVRPEVYFAPPLAEACAAELEPPKEYLEADMPPQTSFARQQREVARRVEAAKSEAATRTTIKSEDPSGELMKEGVLHVVSELVVGHKEELWQAFWDKDEGLKTAVRARSGFVTAAVWELVCRTVLGPKVDWVAVGHVLRVQERLPPHQGAVDYNRFLHRFHVTLRDDGCVRATWMEPVLAMMLDKLLAQPVQDLLDCFDQDKNGRLTIAELSTAFKSLDAGLTGAQVRALFLTFASHCDQQGEEDIEVESFLSALVVAAREQSDEFQSRHARARSAWPRWARRYLRHLGKDMWEQNKGDHMLLEAFKSFDADGNGLLSPEEFVRIMTKLQASVRQPTTLALPPHALQDLAKLSDFDKSGSVSYIEILLALQPTDTTLGGHVRFDLFEQICSTVWNNKQALLRALHNLDEARAMRADAGMLTKALNQLNRGIGGDCRSRRPLLKFQIEALVGHINFDQDGFVDYHAFLDAFQVADCGH